ncbi:MAG: putative OmpR family two-component response regulator [Oscillospiraceae bacterium]|jgi:DNA-binding response OmpR family regulator|nr:putative OmpR family two-component response regulator [Oscillospiraceae bacterium]
MLVDDEPDLLKLVSNILKDEGFENIVIAASAIEGIAVGRNEKPDLAIYPFGYENSLNAHVRRVREKIETDPSKQVSLINELPIVKTLSIWVKKNDIG